MTDPGSPVHLVFGASGGIGAALCRQLAARGDGVVLAGRDESRLAALAEEAGGLILVADAGDAASASQAVASTIDTFGRLDGAVNLAGSVLLEPAHRTSVDQWNEVIATNLTTAFNVVRAAAPAMKAGGGSIVLVSSAAATVGLPNHDAIGAAKAGVEGLARSAAASYAGSGVRVNCVAPGLVRTPLTARITSNEQSLAGSAAMHPLGRIGEPDDIAAAICFLLTPAAAWITGQVYGVDGGLSSLRRRQTARA